MDTPYRILIVDDDPTDLLTLVRSLGKAGYETLQATTGPEAVDVFRRQVPDLVLLDVSMPGLSGFEVCTILKSQEETAGTPVLFTTGSTNPRDIETAFSVGGSDYVTKPLRISEIKARLSVHLQLRHAQRALEESHVQLLRAQKLESIGQLAAGVAHEINTPTQYVSDNTRFLQESFAELTGLLETIRGRIRGSPSEDAQRILAEVTEAMGEADLDYLLKEVPKSIEQSIEGLGRIATIVRAMKDFSHPGATEKAKVDLNRAIESTIAVACNEWRYVSEVGCDLDPDLPSVYCAIGGLNQVVLNLIVNAAHAIADENGNGSREKGVITITTRRDGEMAEIRLTDTGAGIPKKIRGRVFDPFFSTKGVGKGTGQGLALAHSVVVDAHGGSISVESAPGQGSTFIIRLPLESQGAAEAA
jgi:signal transduction histidine kinase